jgi:serine/threonine protein kinase/Tol biopolymer transport system component
VSPQTIAHYRIAVKLGEGGMGEVWRATDTKLNRDVAIKILPETFALDADRMARFTREAQVLASLNHPNIAAIYGVEERALVLELVEGPTLAELIAAGPIPLEDALPIARQIAEALEYAHERGIIHRDLKPANVKVTPEGNVKVLDFGLAKALSADTGAGDPASSPTLTMRATQVGVIMGTAAYMSPEQARGQAVDRRADIWAFGVVLCEMLTGRPLFAGPTISDTLAAVLKTEPNVSAVPAQARPVVERCLRKGVRQRWQAIGDVRIALEEGLPTAEPKRRESWLHWGVTAVLFLLLVVLAIVHFRETPPEAPLTRTYVPPPDRTTFSFSGGLSDVGPVALSPDGRLMAFSAKSANTRSQLWIRRLDALTAQPLAGTEEAIHPFWSPDSRFIGFFAGGKLKKIDAAGGPPVTLCEALSGRGGTWNEAGVIVFSASGIGLGLQRVPASGGVPAPLIVDVVGRWPRFLPDGRHFLYSAGTAVRLGSLDSKATKLLVETLSDAVYTQGHILYLRDDILMAQPFDLKRLALSGEPVPIAENVRSVGALRRGIFTVSQNGMLAYQSGGGQGRFSLTWFDRAGKRLGTLGEAGDMVGVSFSPDRHSVATGVIDPVSRTFDVWLYDAATERRTRFTFDGLRLPPSEIWSPDGTSIVFDANRNGKYGLYRKAANLSGGEDLLYADDVRLSPTSWSPDGKAILYLRAGVGTFALPLTGERKPFPVVSIAVLNSSARFSPDGRWIAYVSPESQRAEIYAMPFSGAGGKVQISISGGTQPRWRGDGREIFYVAPDSRLIAAEIKANGPSLEVGSVQPLFGGMPTELATNAYDVTLDGQRFLVAMPSESATPEPLTLVQNWTVALKK